MKRQIKFRGKRTDTGEWVFGDLIHGVGSKHGRMYILPVTHIYPKGCNELDGWEVLPDTVGQFTGLLDKNSREIYEGDFIKIQWNFEEESVEEISYSVECAYWMYGNNPLCEIIGEECCYEVVGSVHDNPELLKGGKP